MAIWLAVMAVPSLQGCRLGAEQRSRAQISAKVFAMTAMSIMLAIPAICDAPSPQTSPNKPIHTSNGGCYNDIANAYEPHIVPALSQESAARVLRKSSSVTEG
ncbi:hypothetical protein BCR41DRAFT_376009 [Lobosporangium transversale]|uniref:Uncharacterized protein n=1 Tax=Lobosporangium transversale TaxID=64571 RepID=A0A1Y2G693_9FUNG|nr:hypothetical protein BCR41DRAFT_376004 [Lobosporangium transversale]XP_021875192.1 hypothetical protein BCR41DRAFT_376009 [Lobosporangium transversale]ORY93692.1 hypothetical protein BCR41DRAFT_376004 [Lobosporangium transversale]ORY93697.1 hypothetical protein BCR41DRAFT_376009 [Lobosporangium transversale]|eukprot:XP_021875187.1 hypothetical protein BCR41DRAFT_376004 [Lobosporangium transversale]